MTLVIKRIQINIDYLSIEFFLFVQQSREETVRSRDRLWHRMKRIFLVRVNKYVNILHRLVKTNNKNGMKKSPRNKKKKLMTQV